MEKENSSFIQVSNLKKYFKEVKAVDGISFSIEKGELFSLLGENGAGKSTTIGMMCTELKPTDGCIKIGDYEVGKNDNEIRSLIGIVHQGNCLDGIITVKENIEIRGGLYGLSKAEIRENMNEIALRLEITDLLNRKFGQLSGGQKRKCELAASLIHKPQILFLDEPTTGLDPASRKNLWSIVRELRAELGMTVFLTTHYMEEAAKSSHICIIDHGFVKTYGTPFELKEKYAKDRLYIVPKDGAEDKIGEYLKNKKTAFEKKEERFRIFVNSSMETIPYLNDLKQYISGYEMIQGTMDDVFLNVTADDSSENADVETDIDKGRSELYTTMNDKSQEV